LRVDDDFPAGRPVVLKTKARRWSRRGGEEYFGMTDWSGAQAPSIEDIERLAAAAYARLPEAFRKLCEGIVIHVVDFPDDETLDEMGAESEFDLLGLFRGRGMAQSSAVAETGVMPNMIWLYRRPLLDYWCDGADTLGAVVTHVLVHEIGHHFGFSDADMEAIGGAAL
jgi:predicted Zn-dependent protease with MMP-like domain